MKKILSMILALAMVLALGVTAFAAETTWDGTNYSNGNTQGVTATYTPAADAVSAGNIYSVNLTWTDVSVAYAGAVAGTYKWNPTSLKYELVENSDKVAQWNDDSITIGVENRSNANITATATYEASDNETLTFVANGVLDLGSAAIDTENGNAVIDYDDTTTQGKEQTGTITGTMGGEIAAAGTLGTITITLTHE